MIGRGGADEEDPIAQSEAAVAMDQDDPRKWPAPLRFIGDAAKLDPGHGGLMFDNAAGDVAVGLGNADKAREGAPAPLSSSACRSVRAWVRRFASWCAPYL